VLYTPCSETEVYIALTMLDHDEAAKESRSTASLEALVSDLGI